MGKLIDSLANNNGIWVLVGIIVGVLVEIGVDYMKKKSQRKQNTRNLIFEIRLNIKKIDRWLGFVQEYRNQVSTDTPDKFYESFDFSNAIFITANLLFSSGELYNILKDTYIEKLQENATFLSISSEDFVRNQIHLRRSEVENIKKLKLAQEDYAQLYQEIKSEMANNIWYYEKNLKECKNNFGDILTSIDKKR